MSKKPLEPGDVVVYASTQAGYRYLNGHMGVVTGPPRPRREHETEVFYPIQWITAYDKSLIDNGDGAEIERRARERDEQGIEPAWSHKLLRKIGHIEIGAITAV